MADNNGKRVIIWYSFIATIVFSHLAMQIIMLIHQANQQSELIKLNTIVNKKFDTVEKIEQKLISEEKLKNMFDNNAEFIIKEVFEHINELTKYLNVLNIQSSNILEGVNQVNRYTNNNNNDTTIIISKINEINAVNKDNLIVLLHNLKTLLYRCT